MAAGVDAADELLAEEAALGERDRVELEERLLRDRRLVDVDALHAGCRPSMRSASNRLVGDRHPGGAQRRRGSRRGAAAPMTSTPSSDDHGSSHRGHVAVPECACDVDDVEPGADAADTHRPRTRRQRSTDSSAVDPDLEPVERRRELRAEAAGSQSSHGLVADRAASAEVDVELALGREQERRARPARRSSASRSCETRLWRNENASSAARARTTTIDAARRRDHGSCDALMPFPLVMPSGASCRDAAAAVSNACALLWHSRSSSAGIGVGDDPGPGLHARLAVAPDHRADRDRGVEVAGEVEVADDAGVRAALRRLELVDDLHRPHLGRAAHRARRERGPQHVDRVARRRRARRTTWLVRCITCE